VGTLGVGIMNSTAFSFLASNNLEVDEDQEMELTFGSLSFYIGPSGSIRLSDPTKAGPSASKTGEWRIIMSSINHGTEVPTDSRREVLMGYQYVLHQHKKKLREERDMFMRR
jgi:hypothetical protein